MATTLTTRSDELFELGLLARDCIVLSARARAGERLARARGVVLTALRLLSQWYGLDPIFGDGEEMGGSSDNDVQGTTGELAELREIALDWIARADLSKTDAEGKICDPENAVECLWHALMVLNHARSLIEARGEPKVRLH